MAKTRDQKKKLLFVYKILMEQTDENHPMNTAQLIDALEKYDIYAERKSIYTDIDALKAYGCDILNKSTRPAGYYVASRDFEEIELKLLVDTVQASKFMTKKQSKTIIDKLKQLTNQYESAKLEQRNVNLSEPLKQTNNNSFHIVDYIHEGIHTNQSVTFQYFDWDVKGKYVARHGGKIYNVSPYSLTFDSDKYYLIGYDNDSQSIRNYRVDKISGIELSGKEREGKQEFQNFDLPKYNRQTFGMFNGNVDNVIIQFEEGLCGVMIDRFGTKSVMRPLMTSDKYYGVLHAQINVEVAISKQFFGWLAGLEGKAIIIGPEKHKKAYQDHLQSVLELNQLR